MTRSTARTLLLLTAVTLAACSRKPEPVTTPPATNQPPQTQPTGPDTAAIRRAREDSIARANSAAAAAREAETREVRNTLAEMVFFDYDQSSIRSDQQDILNRKVPIMRANPSLTVRIEGHADERGAIEYNLALSLRRANALRDYLVGFGIDASRIEVAALGEERPLEPGTSEDAYARNRRGEFHIVRGGDTLVRPR